MLCNPVVHRQIEVCFLCGIGQQFQIVVFSIDFGNGFRNPAFALGTEPLAFSFYGILVTGWDTWSEFSPIISAASMYACVLTVG